MIAALTAGHPGPGQTTAEKLLADQHRHMVERVFGDLVAPSEYRAASQNRSAIRFAEGDPERRVNDAIVDVRLRGGEGVKCE